MDYLSNLIEFIMANRDNIIALLGIFAGVMSGHSHLKGDKIDSIYWLIVWGVIVLSISLQRDINVYIN
jgi:hypothetical protein